MSSIHHFVQLPSWHHLCPHDPPVAQSLVLSDGAMYTLDSVSKRGTESEVQLSASKRHANAMVAVPEENELGINCVAVPVYFTSARIPSGAVSVSALKFRTPLRNLVDDIEAIRTIASGRELQDPAVTVAS